MKILVTGASGLVGRNLIRHLLLAGHEVSALARTPQKVLELPEQKVVAWKDSQSVPLTALRGLDAVVHLAGEGVADKRWTAERKSRLVSSRVEGTKHIVNAMAQLDAKDRPKVMLSASAIGYYGETGDLNCDEDSPAGAGFLAKLCEDWESQALEAEKAGVRVVLPRIGIVLSKEGGALSKMGPAVLGSGRQWMSWVHIDDLINFITLALENTNLRGAYNLTSPNPARNVDFTRALAKALSYPFVLPTPEVVLKAVLGEMAEMLLGSQRILPTRTLACGFEFQHPTLPEALAAIYGSDNFLDNHLIVNQFVPLMKKDIFPFFSKAENLEKLTPPWLNFHIVKKTTPTIEKNTLIDYKLKIRGVPVTWRTQISEWNPNDSFVDDQLKGPYNKWHHLHRFDEVPGGTLLRDEVTFRLPGWALGKVFLTGWIRRDVETIFSYRQKVIRELYKKGELK